MGHHRDQIEFRFLRRAFIPQHLEVGGYLLLLFMFFRFGVH